MGRRGRVSLAQLSVVPHKEQPRPEPPSELTKDQADIWRGIVSSLPPDWFKPDTFPLLVQYCRHIYRARQLSKIIERFERGAKTFTNRTLAQTYMRLLAKEEDESRIITVLATKMRISQQSTYDKSKKKGKSSSKLWDPEIVETAG